LFYLFMDFHLREFNPLGWVFLLTIFPGLCD
jgi:hypothetical protein